MPTRAPSRCNEPGCPEIAVLRGRCDIHQRKAWEGRSPFVDRYGMTASEWAKLKSSILHRDNYVCYECHIGGADTVDHIVPVAEGGARSDPANLAAMHQEPCHDDKTKREAARGVARRRATRSNV